MSNSDLKLTYIFEYLDKRAPGFVEQYNSAIEIARTYPDCIDLMEFVIARTRMELFSEFERDILSIIGSAGYYPK